MFISFLSSVTDFSFIQKNIKTVEENVNILAKQLESSEYIVQLVQLLCGILKQSPLVEIVSLIRTAINPDVKFEAVNKNTDDVLQS